jgi:hypothetical protein
VEVGKEPSPANPELLPRCPASPDENAISPLRSSFGPHHSTMGKYQKLRRRDAKVGLLSILLGFTLILPCEQGYMIMLADHNLTLPDPQILLLGSFQTSNRDEHS